MKNMYKIIITIFVIAIVGIIISFVYNKEINPSGNYSQTNTTNTSNTTKNTEGSIVGCYVAHLQKDIYTLIIQSEENGEVFGMLAYNNYQKDSSSGSFEGTFADGILLGNYSFDSEGMHSDRQVMFKKVGDSFIQGFGPVKMVDNKEVLETDKVTFDSNSIFVKSNDCLLKFTDANNVFSFIYNPFFKSISGFDKIPTTDWSVDSKQKGILLASVIIPKTYMPNTNFSNARFNVGRSTDPNAIKSCEVKTLGSYTEGGTSDISGYPFKKFTFNGAAAGNFYDTTSYRGIVDGDCYAIEYTIHSTNIGNYSPDQGIVEFDESIIQNDIERIIKSFKFLINSD